MRPRLQISLPRVTRMGETKSVVQRGRIGALNKAAGAPVGGSVRPTLGTSINAMDFGPNLTTYTARSAKR